MVSRRTVNIHADLIELRVQVNQIMNSSESRAEKLKKLVECNVIDNQGRRWMPDADGRWLAGTDGMLVEADPRDYVPAEPASAE